MATKQTNIESVIKKFKQQNSLASLLQKGKIQKPSQIIQQRQNRYEMDSEQLKEAELLFNNPHMIQEKPNHPIPKEDMQEEDVPKIKSILKQSSLVEEPQVEDPLDKKNKSVSFYEQGRPIYIVTSDKKWDEKIQNEKKGKFDQYEHKALADAVGQFLVCNQIQIDEFKQMITQKDKEKGILRKQKFFKLLAGVLPQRSPSSCYKYIIRNFNNFNHQGAWKQEQVEQLLALVDKYGRKWKLIAKQMKRTSDNIYDKYRSLGEEGLQDRVKGIWKLRELVCLLTELQNQSKIQFLDLRIKQSLTNELEHDTKEQQQFSKHKYNSKNFVFHNIQVIKGYIDVKRLKSIDLQAIRWKKIMRKIVTKNTFDCRNKVIQILQVLFRNNQTLDELLINFLEKQNVNQQVNINWKKWKSTDNTPQQARNRFMILKKIVQGRSRKPFPLIIQQMRIKINRQKQSHSDV